jgi:hypothetical protein
MPLPELGRRLRNQAPQRRLSRRKISLENISNARDAKNTLARRIKNMRIRLTKHHTQISITKLRDKKQVDLNLSTRATSFKVKQSFILMTSVPSTLPFLSSPKVTYSLCDRGVRLENHFLFLVMCHEQPESMSHVSSKPPSITYIGQENVDGSVLGLVR